MMRVVCTNDQLLPLPETDTEQIVSMISALGRSNFDVELLLPFKWGQEKVTAYEIAKYYEVEENFRVTSIESAFPSIRALEKIGHAVAALFDGAFKDADVLYTRNLPSAVAALCFSKKPVVYETYRPWPEQVRATVPILKWMNSKKRFLGIVTHSQLAGHSFVDIGIPEDKILVAHNGYDPVRMLPILSKREARDKLNLLQSRRIVTYAGNVNMAKGLDLMIELAKGLSEAQFVIVGSKGEGDIERLSKALHNIRIVPWQTFKDTVQYLYASDVLLIPPTSKPLEEVGNTVLPIKTFLYMASGRPIFGPATPDLQEVLKSGLNAVLVEPDNYDVALEALRALLKSDEKLEELGRQAAYDVQAMTWDNRAVRVRDFIVEHMNRLADSR